MGTILVDGKEAYEMFLESEFWRRLSWECREKAGFVCQRCKKEAQCQAHHTLYREHWFDTKLEDLECICRECHEEEHGIRISVAVKAEAVVVVPAGGWTSRTLNRSRSRGEISRQYYLRIRSEKGWGKQQEKAACKEKARRKWQTKKAGGHVGKKRQPQWWPGIYEGIAYGQKPAGYPA